MFMSRNCPRNLPYRKATVLPGIILVWITLFLQLAETPVRGQSQKQAEARASQADQPAADAGVPEAGGATAAPDVETLRAFREKTEQNADLSEVEKSAILSQVDQAIALLEQAQASELATRGYRESLETAPARTRQSVSRLKEVTQSIETIKQEGVETLEGEQLTQMIADISAQLETLSSELAEVNEQLVQLRTRPDLARQELDKTQEELKMVREEVGAAEAVAVDPADPDPEISLSQARLVALEAREQELRQELLSQEVRRNELLSRQELLENQLGLARTRLQALKTMQDESLRTQVAAARQLAEQAQEVLPAEVQSEALQELAVSIEELAEEFDQTATWLRRTTDLIFTTSAQVSSLQRDYLNLRSQYELLKAHGAFGEALLEQYRRMPEIDEIEQRDRTNSLKLAQVRLRLFYLSNGLVTKTDLEQLAADLAKSELGEDADEARLAEVRGQIEELLTQRRQLGVQLIAQYERLIRELGQLDTLNRQARGLITDIRGFLDEKLLYARSSPRISALTFLRLPELVPRFFGTFDWWETGRILLRTPLDLPILTFLAVCVLGLLIYLRPLCRRTIEETNRLVKRVSTDRIFYTVQALLATAVLSVPFPLVIALCAWRLDPAISDSEFVSSLQRLGFWLALNLFLVILLHRLTRPQGVFIQHLRLPERPVLRVNHALWLTAPLYLPVMFLVGLTIMETRVDAYNSLGRLLFMGILLWLTWIAWYLLNPKTGILAERITDDPGSWLSHLRWVWVVLGMAQPVVLLLAAASGYFLSAVNHQVRIELTLALALALFLVYQLVSRWIFKTERQHLLEERLKQWTSDSKEDTAQAATTEDIQEAASLEVEQAEISMERISQHTRNLLQFAVQVGVVLLLWYLFAGYLTTIEQLDTFMIAGTLSWRDLLLALVALIPTIILVKNAPGLLDGIILRHLPVAPGTRYAISTLTQYAVLTVGLILAIAQLGVDWSVLGWLAAALGVGIGFGLQEIVGNFICGIILLFERPIRVGDVVSMGETTGVVSRIQIRATTITNWDRMEVVIPNKSFVTGEFTNWTLSNAINRVVIVVGVAYGSDTRKACEIITQVARDNEFVCDDPEPRVFFEEFGDSTLNLVLRAYLPDMENRLTAIHQLHTEIDYRFRDADIEIAFPQRDLHLRSVDTAAARELNAKASP